MSDPSLRSARWTGIGSGGVFLGIVGRLNGLYSSITEYKHSLTSVKRIYIYSYLTNRRHSERGLLR